MDIVEHLRATSCDQPAFSPEHAKCRCRVANAAADQIERMRCALGQIAEGRGAFSRDQLTFATNCIESMKEIARNALADK